MVTYLLFAWASLLSWGNVSWKNGDVQVDESESSQVKDVQANTILSRKALLKVYETALGTPTPEDLEGTHKMWVYPEGNVCVFLS